MNIFLTGEEKEVDPIRWATHSLGLAPTIFALQSHVKNKINKTSTDDTSDLKKELIMK